MTQPNRPPLPQRISVFCLACQHTRPLAEVARRVRIDLNHEAGKATYWWACLDCAQPNADTLNLKGNRDWVAFQALVDGGAEVCDHLAGAVLTTADLARMRAEMARTILPVLRTRHALGEDTPMYQLMPQLDAEIAAWGWTA